TYELTHKETHQVGLSSLSSTSEALIEDLSVPFRLVPWVPSPHLQHYIGTPTRPAARGTCLAVQPGVRHASILAQGKHEVPACLRDAVHDVAPVWRDALHSALALSG
ncbi:hypothetical protein HAX54_053299, partial [Datura stramonium]|nr:hypothetical protein [Datura stramonium]